MNVLICRNVCMAYENRPVLENVSFTLEAGDYLCVVGENGSGKSTLLRGLLGLHAPRSGEIRYGEGITPREIGYLPQQTIVQQDFPASVYEVVLSGCLSMCGLRPFFRKEEKMRAQKAMEQLEITAIRNKSYRDLSGGQQQRVLLARAICSARKLLFLDEPVAGLDPLVMAELYRIIRDLNQTQGITIVMISHDIQSAVKNANKILHLGKNESFFGTTQEYRNSDVGRRFLGGAADV